MALFIYEYAVGLEDVVITGPEGTFTLNITGLTAPMDYYNPTIIDPNAATLEIHLRSFVYPPADAAGTITIDGSTVLWSDIYPLLD